MRTLAEIILVLLLVVTLDGRRVQHLILRRLKTMATKQTATDAIIAKLTADVQANTDAEQSAAAALTGLSAQLADALAQAKAAGATDAQLAALQGVATGLEKNTADLAAAIAANTAPPAPPAGDGGDTEAPPPPPPPPSFELQADTPDGQVGVSYNGSVEPRGGMPPWQFSVDGGSLPDGLSIAAGGVISGTPTTAGSSTATVTAHDANNVAGQIDVTITIADAAAG